MLMMVVLPMRVFLLDVVLIFNIAPPIVVLLLVCNYACGHWVLLFSLQLY